MIQAHIELYLKAEGRKQFKDWFRCMGKMFSQFQGFINAQVIEIEGGFSPRVTLIFDNRDNLQHLLDSDVFDVVMGSMEHHLFEAYRVTLYTATNFLDYKNDNNIVLSELS